MTTYHQLYWLRYVNKKWRTPCNSCLVENTSNNRQRFGLVQVSNSNRFKKLKLKPNQTTKPFKPKPLKPNCYKKFKLKPNYFKDFQTSKPLNHKSVVLRFGFGFQVKVKIQNFTF